MAAKYALFPDEGCPQSFLFPHPEIKIFMVMSLGMFDSAVTVVTTPGAAHGWKVVALLIISTGLAFVFWFIMQGIIFTRL